MSQLAPLANHEGTQAVTGRGQHKLLELNPNGFKDLAKYVFISGQDFYSK